MNRDTFFWLSWFTVQMLLIIAKCTISTDLSWWLVFVPTWGPILFLTGCLIVIVLLFGEKTPEELEEEDAKNTGYTGFDDL